MLILAWIFSCRWDLVWQNNWFTALLGIFCLPYTTVMYMLVDSLGLGITGWDWIWIALGALLDIYKRAGTAQNRRQVPWYPQ